MWPLLCFELSISVDQEERLLGALKRCGAPKRNHFEFSLLLRILTNRFVLLLLALSLQASTDGEFGKLQVAACGCHTAYLEPSRGHYCAVPHCFSS